MKTLTNITRELPRPQEQKPRLVLTLLGVGSFLVTNFHLVHRIIHETEWMGWDPAIIAAGWTFTLYAIDPDRADRWWGNIVSVIKRK